MQRNIRGVFDNLKVPDSMLSLLTNTLVLIVAMIALRAGEIR